MNENELLIERYVNAVLRRIPEGQRTDIGQELRGLIDDMLEERCCGQMPTKEQVEEVLNELGNPAEMARKYRGQDKHIIGEQYYDMYWKVLKIVLIVQAAVFAGYWTIRLILNLAKASLSADVEDLIKIPFMGVEGFWDLIPMLLAAVGAVTIVFMIIEYRDVKLNKQTEAWTVAKLPVEPAGGKPIKRLDSIVDLIFAVIFLAILCAAPEFVGAWVKKADGTFRGISIFNMNIYYSILPWIALGLILGMLRNIVILCVPRYTPGVSAVIYVTEIARFLLTVVIMTTQEFFNPNFITEIEEAFGKNFDSKGDLLTYYTSERLGYIIILFCAIGLIVTLIKTTVGLAHYRKRV